MAGVTVTDRAREELQKMLVETSPQQGESIRLVTQPGGGFAIGLDQVREDDDVVEAGEETVLVIASDLAKAVEGAVIDVEETEKGPMLTISR